MLALLFESEFLKNRKVDVVSTFCNVNAIFTKLNKLLLKYFDASTFVQTYGNARLL